MGDRDPWATFDVDRDDRAGRWLANIDDIWVAWAVPLGGTSAAVAAEAMAAELSVNHPAAEGQRLRSLHCVFAAPVPAGPVVADVNVLRAGRSQSQVQSTLHGPGETAGLTAVAAFGATRPGYAFRGSRPPEVPPPEDCPSWRDPPPPEADWNAEGRPPMWEELIEGRAALGLPPWDPSPRSDAESAAWFRFDQPPPAGPGGTGPSPIVVLSDLMLGGIGQRLGRTDEEWFGPSVDLTVHLVAPPRPGWILSHNRAHVAGDGYASLETTLWGPGATPGELEMVAFATQQMYFWFPDGPPPPERCALD